VFAAGLLAFAATGCDSSLAPGAGTGGSGGQGTGGTGAEQADAGGGQSGDAGRVCHDLFADPSGASPPVACCPDPEPDCSQEPDGYPGYHCVSIENEFCSCSCQAGQWSCGC